MMKKLALYPFNRELSPIARYIDLLPEYDRCYPLVPNTFSCDGLDISSIDGGDFHGIKVSSDCDKIIDQCDSLYIDFDKRITKKAVYEALIQKGIDHGKEVIVSKTLQKYLAKDNLIKGNYASNFIGPERLYKIDVPVITIMGTGENSNKFELQLALRRYFLSKGYKVSQFGTKEYSELFGFDEIPFIYEDISVKQRILKLNQYLCNVVNEQKPDLIILGVPGSIMKYNDMVLNDFAEPAHIINNAVIPDIAILSILYEQFTPEYFHMLNNYCKYSMNCEIDYFNIANCKASYDEETKDLRYIYLDSNYVMNNILSSVVEDITLKVANILQGTSSEQLCSDIERKLASNVELI
ncbi:MAG: peptide maturation system protein family [Herbinix sp.]|jgi:peptide maturation system protein (TIGR04066 family)|nr:peptide maturation system protein family [Herbinix sp.]